MNSPELWVLTVSPAQRRAEAVSLFDSMNIDPGHRVTVTTQPSPIQDASGLGELLVYPGTDINISKWWSLGLDFIQATMVSQGVTEWDVLVMESDARMTREDVDTVRSTMRHVGVSMAGADWHHILTPGGWYARLDNAKWVPAGFSADQARLPGMALVVAGEKGIRHDPEMRWWLADDDFEWQHRVNGGTVLVGGTTMHHEGTQGPLVGERLQAFREDQVKFLKKWGGLPENGGVPEEATQ